MGLEVLSTLNWCASLNGRSISKMAFDILKVDRVGDGGYERWPIRLVTRSEVARKTRTARCA